MKRKFGYKIHFTDLALIGLGFALAFFDMTVLQKGVRLITGTNAAFSSLIAFSIATIANSFALDWGITNGKTQAKRAINKASSLGFIAWLAFGVGYIIIEAITTADAINKAGAESINWANQIGQYLILLLSYVFSGCLIQKSSREMFDADAFACRDAENEYKRVHKKLARQESKIKGLLNDLESYENNYDSLKEQRDNQSAAIRHTEESVMNEIVGKTLQANPEISPSKARNILDDIRKDYLK